MLNLILALAGCKHHHVGFPMVALYNYIGSHTILNQIRSEYNSIRKKILFLRPNSHYIAISVKFSDFVHTIQ